MTNNNLKNNGINPASFLEKAANRTYIAYNGGNKVVEKYLYQHPREEKTDYIYRKSISYSFERTNWATRFITRTIDNKKHRVHRDFDPLYSELEKMANSKKSNGRNWDSILKELTIDSMLGGISYLFLNINNIKELLTDETKNIDTSVLIYDQVSNIVMNKQGFFSQCAITFKIEDSNYELYYYMNRDDVPTFELYESQDNGSMEFIDGGYNALGFAPIIPLYFIGSIENPGTITSPIQKISKIDIDIMNLYSDSRNAFGFHNYPWIALPTPEGGIDGVQIGLNREDGNPHNNSLQKVALGPAQGFYYDSNVGEPKIIEPSNVHIEQTTKLIDYLEDEILNILGAGIEKDHPLSSGISKMFTFNNTNELYRHIHSVLERFEYNVFFIGSLLLGDDRRIEFADFESLVTINHPKNFDPTSSKQIEKIKEFVDSSVFNMLDDDTKELIIKKYLEQSLSDAISDNELSELLETVNIKKQEQLENANAEFVTPDNIEEQNPIIQQQ